jgi:glutamate decarboxylase
MEFLYFSSLLDRFKMPENSIPKEAAFQIINDELMLDGNPRLNLASFVTTWMEPECDKLIMASINKNYVDMDEYPVTTELQASHLLHTHTHTIFFQKKKRLNNYPTTNFWKLDNFIYISS